MVAGERVTLGRISEKCYEKLPKSAKNTEGIACGGGRGNAAQSEKKMHVKRQAGSIGVIGYAEEPPGNSVRRPCSACYRVLTALRKNNFRRKLFRDWDGGDAGGEEIDVGGEDRARRIPAGSWTGVVDDVQERAAA